MKFILSGGGTMGSVSPLIAICEEIKKRDASAEFLWLATKNGPEERLIDSYHITVKKIHAGKLRRYWSGRNFIDPIFILLGFVQSFLIMRRFRPDWVLTAGGFVAVPVVWAARWLGVPSFVHQQDVIAGLANKLMARSAKIVTVTFKKSLADFAAKNPVWTGNPVRPEILSGNAGDGYAYFGFKHFLPTILIIGGGTGARGLNTLVAQSLERLVQFCQVIHLTGGKVKLDFSHAHYRQFDFLTDQLKNAYAISDLVVSRAGMQVLSELALLKKPTLVIPLPQSHQEANANEFFRQNAVAWLDETKTPPEIFVQAVSELLSDSAVRTSLSHNIGKIMPPDSAVKIVNQIYESAA